MGGGLKLVLIGGAIGLGAAMLVAPVLGSLLFGIRPMDVVAFTTMPLILGLVALAAGVRARASGERGGSSSRPEIGVGGFLGVAPVDLQRGSRVSGAISPSCNVIESLPWRDSACQ